MSDLLEQIDAMKSKDAEAERRAYVAILRRHERPEEGDVTLLGELMRSLGITHEQLAADVDRLQRYRDCKAGRAQLDGEAAEAAVKAAEAAATAHNLEVERVRAAHAAAARQIEQQLEDATAEKAVIESADRKLRDAIAAAGDLVDAEDFTGISRTSASDESPVRMPDLVPSGMAIVGTSSNSEKR